EKNGGNKEAFVNFMAADHGEENFPETTHRKDNKVNRYKISSTVPETIPDTLRIITGKQADKRTAPAFHRGQAHISHDGVRLEAEVVHAVEHGRESTQPHSNHDALEVDTVANMRGGLGHIGRTIKDGIYRFIQRIPLFVFATFVEVWLDLIEKITQEIHLLTLLLDKGEVVTQDRAVFIFAWAHKGTQSQIFLIQFQSTEFLGSIRIPHDQRTQLLGRQDIQRHDVFVRANRNHCTLTAVSGGGEAEFLASQQARGIDTQGREEAEAGTQVVQHRTVASFQQYGYLVMVAAKEGERTACGTATKYRTGNQTVFTGLQLSSSQFFQAGTQTGTHQARLLNLRTGKGYNAVSEQLTRGKQLTEGDDVLVTDSPDSLGSADGIQEVNMSASITSRVNATELFHDNALIVRRSNISTRSLAQEELTLGKTRQHSNTMDEILGMLTDDDIRTGCERVGICGGNKDGVRFAVERGDFAERTGTKCGP